MAGGRKAVIRASELGQYMYCSRSWWLRRVEGWEPLNQERLELGTRLHEQHGRAVSGSVLLLIVAGACALAGLVLLLVR